VALGSLTEIENQLIIAKDLGYIKSEMFDILNNQIVVVSKLLSGLIKKTKEFLKG